MTRTPAPPPARLVPRHRFDLLDGARGVASLAITVDHFSLHNGLHWFAGAWVAVDFFFILSGVVITQAYAQRVRDGMGLAGFMWARVKRLWPMYALGLALGLVASLVLLLQGRAPHIGPAELGTALGLGFVFLPYLNDLAWPVPGRALTGAVFPLNESTWTLFFELLANVLFFWRLRLLQAAGVAASSRAALLASLAVVLPVLVVYVLGVVLGHPYNPGWDSRSFLEGLPRVTAQFLIGALIFEHGLHRTRPRPWLAGALALAWLALMCSGRGKPQLLNLVVVVPALVWTLSALQVHGVWQRVCRQLGEMSFPLFIIHYPLFKLLAWTTPLLSWPPLGQMALLLPSSVALALVLGRVDRRLRLGRRGAAAAALPAGIRAAALARRR